MILSWIYNKICILLNMRNTISLGPEIKTVYEIQEEGVVVNNDSVDEIMKTRLEIEKINRGENTMLDDFTNLHLYTRDGLILRYALPTAADLKVMDTELKREKMIESMPLSDRLLMDSTFSGSVKTKPKSTSSKATDKIVIGYNNSTSTKNMSPKNVSTKNISTKNVSTKNMSPMRANSSQRLSGNDNTMSNNSVYTEYTTGNSLRVNGAPLQQDRNPPYNAANINNSAQIRQLSRTLMSNAGISPNNNVRSPNFGRSPTSLTPLANPPVLIRNQSSNELPNQVQPFSNPQLSRENSFINSGIESGGSVISMEDRNGGQNYMSRGLNAGGSLQLQSFYGNVDQSVYSNNNNMINNNPELVGWLEQRGAVADHYVSDNSSVNRNRNMRNNSTRGSPQHRGNQQLQRVPSINQLQQPSIQQMQPLPQIQRQLSGQQLQQMNQLQPNQLAPLHSPVIHQQQGYPQNQYVPMQVHNPEQRQLQQNLLNEIQQRSRPHRHRQPARIQRK